MKAKYPLTLLLILLTVITIPKSSIAQWTALNQSSTTDLFWDVFFIDSNIGYIIGLNGQTLNYWAVKTINGGMDWNAASPALIAEHPLSICFTDINTGYISGTDKISKTINGGLSWTPYNLGLGSTVFLNNIYFYNTTVGHATAWNTNTNAHYMVHTTNSGLSWTTSEGGTSSDTGCNSIYCTDANTCYVAGFNGGKGIYKTTNGGTIWTNIFNPSEVNLYSVYFITASDGIAVGGNKSIQRIYQTLDGGVNWNEVYTGSGRELKSVFFTDTNTGYAVGANGIILNTSNGGAIWNPMISPTIKDLNSVHFPVATTGYAVGYSGTILKYTGMTEIPGNKVDINMLNIYPNPGKDNVSVEISGTILPENLYLYFISTYGEIVKVSIINSPISTIHTGSLSPGIFFYQLRSGIKLLHSGKLIIN